MIRPEAWLDEFEALPIREAVRPGILKDNAARLLRLRDGGIDDRVPGTRG